MTNTELMILFNNNKYYIIDVFKNYKSMKYQFICERFKISHSDCDKLELIYLKSKI
jgi:hypothetical protein